MANRKRPKRSVVGNQSEDYLVMQAYTRINQWRYWHTAICISTFVFSVTTFVCLAFLNKYFNPYCIVGTNWTLNWQPAKSSGNGEKKLAYDPKSTVWGHKETCSYTQFGIGACGIVAFTLGWFFMLFGPNRSDLYDRKPTTASVIVVPFAVVGVIVFIADICGAVMLQNGFKILCDSIVASKLPNITHCYQINGYVIGQMSGDEIYGSWYLFGLFVAAQIAAWLSVVLWAAHIAMLGLRFWWHIDFPASIFVNAQNAIPLSAQKTLEQLIVEAPQQVGVLRKASSMLQQPAQPNENQKLENPSSESQEKPVFASCSATVQNGPASSGHTKTEPEKPRPEPNGTTLDSEGVNMAHIHSLSEGRGSFSTPQTRAPSDPERKRLNDDAGNVPNYGTSDV